MMSDINYRGLEKFFEDKNLKVNLMFGDNPQKYDYVQVQGTDFFLNFNAGFYKNRFPSIVIGRIISYKEGKGLASQVLNVLKEYSISNNICVIVANKTESIPFWVKNGFQQDSESFDYVYFLK